MSNDFMAEALQRMRDDGLLCECLVFDDEIHRCPVVKKANNKDGAYAAHRNDSFNIVLWWNWYGQYNGQYSSKDKKDMSRKELQEYDRFVKQTIKKVEAEKKKYHEEGAANALSIWNSATPAADDGHHYLLKKEVPSYGLRTDPYGNLLVPVMDTDGNIKGLSRINANGGKRFTSGTDKRGNFSRIPAIKEKEDGPLLIGEGYATMASCHMATGNECWIAFDCGNLLNVGKVARGKYATRDIGICADYDFHDDLKLKEKYPGPGGIGTAKAKEAALAIGGYLIGCPAYQGGKNDFNDVMIRDGLPGVKDIIERALAGKPANVTPDPDGYTIITTGKKPGLYHEKKDQDGGIELEWLGPVINVLAATRNDTSEDWGLRLEWQDMDGITHYWSMPKAILYNPQGEWFARLASGGWFGNPGCRKLIARFFSEVKPVRRMRCIDRLGWYEDCFILPDMAYGQTGNEEKVFQTERRIDLYLTGGTFEEWEEVAKLCTGNSRLGFALACSFAGPLLQLAGMEGGAFSFEGESSSGKTTALKIAASVWGGSNHIRSWRATDNGLESIAALHNDNILVLDELSQIGARALDESSYMLANGSGKTRAARNGEQENPINGNPSF